MLKDATPKKQQFGCTIARHLVDAETFFRRLVSTAAVAKQGNLAIRAIAWEDLWEHVHDAFNKKGFSRETDDGLQLRHQVIVDLIDRFNDMLSELEQEYPEVAYLDLRGSLPDRLEDWANELHPKNAGFAKIAEKFHRLIQRLLEE